MKTTALYTLFALFCATALQGKWVHEKVPYSINGEDFRGHLIYKEAITANGQKQPHLPTIFMVPNWMGPDTKATLEKAKKMAGGDFVVFIADLYGTDVRPSNAKEAGEAASVLRNDRELMRSRTASTMRVIEKLAKAHPINTDKVLGAGFCFGGGTLLEYARTGAQDLHGIVSFHGDLASPTLKKDADKVKIPLLVLHGAEDPYVPQKDVQSFVKAMRKGDVEDWTLVQFSNTVHSFTNPTADSDGARYQPRSAKRAFEMMDDFAGEVLEPKKYR